MLLTNLEKYPDEPFQISEVTKVNENYDLTIFFYKENLSGAWTPVSRRLQNSRNWGPWEDTINVVDVKLHGFKLTRKGRALPLCVR